MHDAMNVFSKRMEQIFFIYYLSAYKLQYS